MSSFRLKSEDMMRAQSNCSSTCSWQMRHYAWNGALRRSQSVIMCWLPVYILSFWISPEKGFSCGLLWQRSVTAWHVANPIKSWPCFSEKTKVLVLQSEPESRRLSPKETSATVQLVKRVSKEETCTLYVYVWTLEKGGLAVSPPCLLSQANHVLTPGLYSTHIFRKCWTISLK